MLGMLTASAQQEAFLGMPSEAEDGTCNWLPGGNLDENLHFMLSRTLSISWVYIPAPRSMHKYPYLPVRKLSVEN